MVEDGYVDIVNVDISSVVIEAMQKKYHDVCQLKYVRTDVRDMSEFESESFDAVVDKGTLDSLMCGHDSQQNSFKMLEEVGRVLKDGGVYILITYGDPSFRLDLLRGTCLWTVNLHVIDRTEKSSEHQSWELTRTVPLNEDGSFSLSVLGPNPEIHYIYVCVKDASLKQKLRENGADINAQN
ncbi:hypothetical protein QJS04_geneDACA015828 [Acorus gramineus]|uniref:Methyltransferase type 11 domain-containing protein n=1 Tax=Acorus gramineus TaxID=55184 RepID=A0AAV9BRI6_ACOGR|nr:hypothetical protein QJS04_geneDACA015828 [Acorus gramineus]